MPRFQGYRAGYSGWVDHTAPVIRDNSAVPESVQFEFDHAMDALFPTPPERLIELRDALGGTNAAAKLIPGKGPAGGIAPRTLQRYIAAEEHYNVSPHSKRRSDYAAREKVIKQLQDAWRARFSPLPKVEKDGMRVYGHGTLRIGNYYEGRAANTTIPGKGWKTILRHWNMGDRKGAAKAFQSWFGKAYGRTGGRSKKTTGNYREDFTWAYLQELTFSPPE